MDIEKYLRDTGIEMRTLKRNGCFIQKKDSQLKAALYYHLTKYIKQKVKISPSIATKILFTNII
jgi:hypothetical protein